MDDYIKRSRALGELKLDYKDIMYIDKQETAARIREIPSADVVKVVRCKECKHGEYREDFNDYLCCEYGVSVHDAEWYCADGER